MTTQTKRSLEDLKVDLPEGQRGRWQVERFEVPENDLHALYYALHGRPVPPGIYTRLNWGTGMPMMSDTPAEMIDHFEFLRQLEMPHVKRVLINGLGIGMCLKWALEQPHVEHVDVVELDEDVAFMVGPHYHAMAERLGKSLTIHVCDAFAIQWPADAAWDVAWHDVWPTICSDNVEEMTRLNRKYGRRVGWQGCWCERECRIAQREGR